ncbi:HipA N-terminal domain-containing protein [Clostridium bowmanii]|uniref:HipA N-terminal domain-containing protein n=1 Tax=Clostridium bowmanii TaxID=132925 RepID=UPI001C0C6EFF|nr:HipA N-terminal domain-containing protein [Clostridium bowmanii]MBU3189074.1 HipA N-terminal domain-containing protein [Clostridium bowmanii]MCA1073824.1 HipA N-terminal domain-containing protein [Clostridium bowmanii]
MRDIIWMTWKNSEEEPFKVGELTRRDKKYYFKYDAPGVEKAEEYGFSPLPNFPRIDVEYFREELFSSFSERLPWHGKRDVSSVLKEYGLEEYDAFELLKKTGGKCSGDSFEFITPFDEESIVLGEK